MRRRDAAIAVAAGAGLAAVAVLAARPRWTAPHVAPRRELLVSCGAPMLALCRAWAQAFARRHPAVDIAIEEGGALPAYLAARSGAIDLAAMMRPLTDSEDDAAARHFLVAKGELDVIVHRASPLRGLAREQVRALLTGAAGHWRAAGGPDLPVRVYAHRRGTVARQLAEEVLLDGSDFAVAATPCERAEAVVAAVARDPAGIAAVATCAPGADPGVRRIAIDGVMPTRAAALSGSYPYAHGMYLLLYGEPGGVRSDFLAFVRGAEGQRIVAAQGLIPAC